MLHGYRSVQNRSIDIRHQRWSFPKVFPRPQLQVSEDGRRQTLAASTSEDLRRLRSQNHHILILLCAVRRGYWTDEKQVEWSRHPYRWNHEHLNTIHRLATSSSPSGWHAVSNHLVSSFSNRSACLQADEPPERETIFWSIARQTIQFARGERE